MSQDKNMRNLLNIVIGEIQDTIKEKYDIRDLELRIVEDDFLIREPEESFKSNYFYIKVNRTTWEVVNIQMGSNKYSLAEVNTLAAVIVTILQKYAGDFDAIFGAKIETIEDFKKHCKSLLESGIEKRYVLGKRVKRESSWNDKEYYDDYGVIFEPNGFLSLEFDEDDKKWEDGRNKRFYCEFEKNTIDSKALAELLIKIVEKNKDIINKYIKEGKENEKN